MPGTVLVTSHRLPLAGALRQAFRAEGYQVELVPTPEHGEDVADPALLVLTGERDLAEGEAWARLAAEGLGVPLFSVLPGPGGMRRGEVLGATEVFPERAPPDEVALVGRRTVERRRLQSLTGIVGDSDAIRELLERVVQIAPVDSTVLVTGESGTGKELVARGIHALSPRKHRAFLAVNVAALSETLLESELFGHEKGAFTGAIDTRKGFFELAHRGTLFLDEIGEMPLSTQTKLLRVLEQREFMRVGGQASISVDVRIVAATNRELREAVARGEFRRDLYYRLNILDLRLPPLRERRGDIPLLIRHFVEEVSARVERPFPGLTREALEILENHDWPGNVRELRNLVESMVVLSPGREIEPRDLPVEVRRPEVALLGPGGWGGEGGRGGGGLDPRPGSSVHAGELSPPRTGPSALAGVDGSGPSSHASPSSLAGSAHPGPSSGRDLPAPVPGLRPELEFVFRTLVDLRVDMEELRREFEAYRREGGAEHRPRALPPGRPPAPEEDRSYPFRSELSAEDATAPEPAHAPPWGGAPGVDGTGTPAHGDTGDPGHAADPDDRAHAHGDTGDPAHAADPDTPAAEPQGDPAHTLVIPPDMTMEELELAAIRAMLQETGGNRREAAERLGIGERTLYRKIRKYELD